MTTQRFYGVLLSLLLTASVLALTASVSARTPVEVAPIGSTKAIEVVSGTKLAVPTQATSCPAIVTVSTPTCAKGEVVALDYSADGCAIGYKCVAPNKDIQCVRTIEEETKCIIEACPDGTTERICPTVSVCPPGSTATGTGECTYEANAITVKPGEVEAVAEVPSPTGTAKPIPVTAVNGIQVSVKPTAVSAPVQVTIAPQPLSNTVAVTSDGVTAVSTKPIKVEAEKLVIEATEVEVLPHEAIAIAKREVPRVSIEKVEITVENEKPVYSASGKVTRKLLGIFPIELDATVKVDAQTKATVVSLPWWSFLTTA